MENFKKIEKEFDDLVSIRLKARSNYGSSILEETEDKFKEAKDKYLKAVYEKNMSKNLEDISKVPDFLSIKYID